MTPEFLYKKEFGRKYWTELRILFFCEAVMELTQTACIISHVYVFKLAYFLESSSLNVHFIKTLNLLVNILIM
jgi:hypothetical protein